eukprot:g3226.t1
MSSSKAKSKSPKADISKCFFCEEPPHDSDSDDDFTEDIAVDPTKKGGRRMSACTDCLIWCPEAYMQGDTWHNIGASLKRCKRLKCHVCKKPYAPLGCQRMGCNKTFHQPCALNADCVFDEEKFVISCLVCHEVMEARRRKKERIKAEKEKRKREITERKAKRAAEKKAKRMRDVLKDKNGTDVSTKSAAKKMKKKTTKKKKHVVERSEPEVVQIEDEENVLEDDLLPAAADSKVEEDPIVHRLRPVVADLFSKLRKDDLPVEVIHDALTAFDDANGRPKACRADLDKALGVLETENRIMYRQYDGRWTVFLI